MKAFLFILFGVYLGISGFAQSTDTSATLLEEVTITGYRDEPGNQSSFHIQNLKLDSINRFGSFSLTDALAKVPGVTMLSTGVGIAKPVIRGLYGNRVLILLNGLKFDNQQWQEEHGLGVSTIGIGSVELIKGPFGILYGTEALGGVINIIEEKKPNDTLPHWDAGIVFNSNTLGGQFQAGYKQAKKHKWWRIRMGIENNADYSDGNQSRVLNSRFDGYCLKTTYGFRKGKWISRNNFSSSFNRFGFIFNDVYTFITPDNRWSRSLSENPAHYVLLNILSSENTIDLNHRSKLQINAGIQSNSRMENEGGGAISLNMHLLTGQYLLRFEHDLNAKNKLILSNLNSLEDNTNFGSRKIVPDAILQESNLSAFLETQIQPTLIFENGAGIGEKYIHTYFTPTVNSPDKEIQPFKKFSPYYNAFTGLTWFPSNHFNLKANLATGVRVANLAELSSDGLHEGIFTFEIGNPNLENEQMFAGNLFSNYSSKYFELSISPFYNYFLNYIYLSPVDEEWFGFPVYRYKQQNATQFGTEAGITFHPVENMSLQVAYSGMVSKTEDGNFTPYIPAQKIIPMLKGTFNIKQTLPVQVFTNVECSFAQNNTAEFEINTPAYQLWNAGASATLQNGSRKYQLSLACNNILNKAYFDHLSRFKNYGLLNLGRNLVLNLKVSI